MRRAGQNPTESEVQDMINSVSWNTFELELVEKSGHHQSPIQLRHASTLIHQKKKKRGVGI